MRSHKEIIWVPFRDPDVDLSTSQVHSDGLLLFQIPGPGHICPQGLERQSLGLNYKSTCPLLNGFSGDR